MSDITVQQFDEALNVLEVALTLDEALRTILTIIGEKHHPVTQLAGISLFLSILQDEKFPELPAVIKSVPKRLHSQFRHARYLLRSTQEAAVVREVGTVH